jgi:hypothetical protein
VWKSPPPAFLKNAARNSAAVLRAVACLESG